MSDIQKARDVLAKWREPLNGLCQFGVLLGDPEVWVTRADGRDTSADGRLLFGTAGNPELLDAIDGMLAAYEEQVYAVPAFVRNTAAAILAADERMSA